MEKGVAYLQARRTTTLAVHFIFLIFRFLHKRRGKHDFVTSCLVKIERWYNENGFYKPIEWNELKKVKELLSKRD